MKSEQGRSSMGLNKYGEIEDPSNRFQCPGCGEKATAKEDGRFCPECKAFVCKDCQCWDSPDPFESNGMCPVCKTLLKRSE
jgi:hypothetical protein